MEGGEQKRQQELLRTLRTAYSSSDLGGEHAQSEHLIQLRALLDRSLSLTGMDTGFMCRATFLRCLGICETKLAGAAVLHKDGMQL